MSRFWPSRAWRQAIRWSVGCSLLLLAGLVILKRAEQVGVTADMIWLGQSTLAPGAPAAQRAWAEGPDGRRLVFTSARLSLFRGERRVQLWDFGALREAEPTGQVLDLNFRVPRWPPGTARLLLEMESPTGSLRMEREVMLDPLIRGRLSLWPPSRELRKPPAGLATAPVGAREGMLSQDGPVSFQVFPLGGRIRQGGDQAWVRAVNRRGQSVQGRIKSGEERERSVDGEGLALLPVGGAVGLSFESPAGRLQQRLELQDEGAPGRLRAKRMLLSSGQDLDLDLADLDERTHLHWELWWLGGWAAGGQLALSAPGGALRVDLPGGLEGPILVRLRRRPEGDDVPARAFALVGKEAAPGMDQAWRLLSLAPGEGRFREETADLGSGPMALAAKLSRLRGPGGALPELGRDRSRGKRPAMRGLAWGLMAAGGLGLLLILGWAGLRRRRRVDPQGPSA